MAHMYVDMVLRPCADNKICWVNAFLCVIVL